MTYLIHYYKYDINNIEILEFSSLKFINILLINYNFFFFFFSYTNILYKYIMYFDNTILQEITSI